MLTFALAEEAEAARRRGGGVTWGMGDDAEEDSEEDEEGEGDGKQKKNLPDMSRNPFAVIREGEKETPDLNLNDPKKTLRLDYSNYFYLKS